VKLSLKVKTLIDTDRR